MITKFINGKIIDKYHQGSEIFIEDGKIIASLSSGRVADEIIDLKGHYVSTGFIDSHVHVFENISLNGVHPDDVGIKMGVTTLIDAGSTGANDYEAFHNEIINGSISKVYSLLNISKTGLVENLEELKNPKDLTSLGEVRELLAKYRNEIVGIKVRLSHSVVGDRNVQPLLAAREIADKENLPIMVHVGNPPPYLPDIFPLLKKGDIVTHAFHGKESNLVLDIDGKLIPSALSALERGVIFDVGHGSASFSFDIFDKYLRNYSEFIFSTSTDIHIRNIAGPVYSLMATLSKLYSYDIPLERLIETVTDFPSGNFGLTKKGSLQPGNDGDLTVFSIENKNIELEDSLGRFRKLERVFVPEMTVIDGKVVWEK